MNFLPLKWALRLQNRSFFRKAVFYIGGSCGVIWCMFWFFFVSDDPEHHRFISTDEKEHILQQRKQPMNEIGKKRPPYLKILMTPNVWVLMLTDFCISFGLYMILTEGPNFISNILDKDIFEVITLRNWVLLDMNILYVEFIEYNVHI